MSAQSQPTPLQRVFKIGANRITDETPAASNEQVRNLLKGQYPEIANATIRETVSGGITTVEFLPVPGRKG